MHTPHRQRSPRLWKSRIGSRLRLGLQRPISRPVVPSLCTVVLSTVGHQAYLLEHNNTKQPSNMNHAIVPKFANPHFFSQGYERTSRAEHIRHTEILPDNNTQDEITDTLKRKLDELLHESWTDVLQSAQAVRDAGHSQNSRKRSKTAACDLGASDDGSVCKY